MRNLSDKDKNLIKALFKEYVEGTSMVMHPYHRKYEDACKYMDDLREKIKDNDADYNEVEEILENAIKKIDIPKKIIEHIKSKDEEELIKDGCFKSKDSFYEIFWRELGNPVASVGQGNYGKDKFEKVKEYNGSYFGDKISFDSLNKKLICKENNTTKKMYEEAYNWFKELKENKVSKISWASINRFFAALYPGKLTVVVSEGKINEILSKLNFNYEEDDCWYSKNKILIEEFEDEFNEVFENLEKEYDNDEKKYLMSSFFWPLHEFLTSFSILPQTVYYGSPGTGKTYKAKEIAELKVKQYSPDNNVEDYIETVQFHPSYTYEDFIEGIRPSGITEEGKAQLELKDGIFKEFCKKAGKWEIDYYKKLLEENDRVEDDFDFSKVTVSKIKDLFKKENENPFDDLITEDANNEDKIIDYIPPYFFIIDEINRAELSRVFGELMYCLEYRGYEGKVKTQYSHLVKNGDDNGAFLFVKDADDAEESGVNYFFIPHNVYIIGTMNIIDRSVESFDFALRRRFIWERIDPDEEVLQAYIKNPTKEEKGISKDEEINKIIKGWKNLNEKIGDDDLLGPDYQIGHTYLFKAVKYKSERRENLWKDRIKPLLEEYLRGLGSSERRKSKIDDFKKAFFDNKNE